MNKIHNGNGSEHGNMQRLAQSVRKTAPIKPIDCTKGASQVNFLTAGGLKLGGTPTRLTRQAATCEIHGGTAALRTSEILTDFEIHIHGQKIYAGRAVVSNLMDAGSNAICEVTLDENHWTKTHPPLAKSYDKITDNLSKEFTDFLAGWQNLYKISPEYKLALVDLQTHLSDLKLWMDQLEMNIRSAPTTEQPALERAVIKEIGQPIFPAFAALFEKFEMAARNVDKSLLPSHQALVKRLLHPLLLCSPFMHRIYFKPLGYAGDYEMVNMILRDPHEGDSLFAKLLNVFILSQVPGEAHRNRVTYLVKRLVEETNRMATRGGICKIYNLGCGPTGEVQQFLTHHKLSNHAHFTLLDADDETLRKTGELLGSIKTKHQRSTPIKLIKKSVYQLLKPSGKNKSSDEEYDFIYSAGLFDYLSDQVGQTIIGLTYDLLAPGGLLLITNVDPVNPIRNIMEHIYDWHLIYRDGRHLATLASDLPAEAAISIKAEITSANVILEIRKPLLKS